MTRGASTQDVIHQQPAYELQDRGMVHEENRDIETGVVANPADAPMRSIALRACLDPMKPCLHSVGRCLGAEITKKIAHGLSFPGAIGAIGLIAGAVISKGNPGLVAGAVLASLAEAALIYIKFVPDRYKCF